jgi:hypothetical protein
MPEVVGGQFRLRVLDPKQFIDNSFRSINIPRNDLTSGIIFVMGKKKIDGVNSNLKVQSIRFNIDPGKSSNGKKVTIWTRSSITTWIQQNISDDRIKEKLLNDIRNFKGQILKNLDIYDQNDHKFLSQLSGSIFD